MEYLSTSHLYAVQKIPGETREEKFKEIGRIVKKVKSAIEEGSDFTSAVNLENVPNALVPLIKVLVGIKIKSHAFIIEALKSDDTHLVVEALRARWLYDGNDESITNYTFFSTQIFPFVSMKTRRDISKRLTVCLANKPTLAEEFFHGFVTAYTLQEAIIYLPACRSNFIYDAIVKYKIFLPNKLLKILYRKYPDLVLRYLKFADPSEKKSDINRTMYRVINIHDYESFMPLLVTKHPELFVKMQEICHTSVSLGKRRTLILLKNAKDLLIKKPREIIDLMPFKLVCDNLKQEEFETMFGNILDERWDMLYVNDMLNYLEYYPQDKASLLRNKVKEKYGYDLFEKVGKVTSKFLLLLPKEERYVLARKIIEIRHKVEVPDCETSWWCYLPVNEAIPSLKLQISQNWKTDKRQKYLSQLIYVCKLNEDKDALLQVLRYVDEKHKTERSDIICCMLDRVTQEFDSDSFNEDYFTVLFNIIKRVKLKKENARDYWVLIKILKKYVHYCDSHNLSYNEIIDHIVQLFLEGRVGISWKLLEDEAKYERKYLDVCFKNNYWLTMDYRKNFIEGIYNFNERHCSNDNSVEKLSIRDYPQLLKVAEETLKKKQNDGISWIIYSKEKLKKHEPELYDEWFPNVEEVKSDSCQGNSLEEKRVPEVKEKVIYLTEAIIALKRNYSEIKNNWLRYYESCKNEVTSKKRWRVKLFLKILLWYHDIPVKFAERAIEEKNFHIMGYLFDGVTFTKLVDTFLFKEAMVDRDSSYLNAMQITAAIRNTTTPIPTELVKNYLTMHSMYSYKNYINDGLKLWSYVSYRTSSDKMIDLSRNLAYTRLFMKRHAIRLMNQMVATNEMVSFFTELWKTDEHPMIRHMLAERTGKLFSNRPCDVTWILMSTCILSFDYSECDILNDIIESSKNIPTEYASAYAVQVFTKLEECIEKGMTKYDAANLLDHLFENLKSSCTDCLPEDFYQKAFKFCFQNPEHEFNQVDRFIVKVYLDPSSVHFQERLQHFSEMLSADSQRWYSSSIERRNHTPNFVDNVVQIIVYQVQTFRGNLTLVEHISNIFSSIFTPYQHAWSHIMLFLCIEYLRVEPSFKQFGSNISERISLLIEKYRPEYFMQIVELIRDFITSFFYEYNLTLKNRLEFLKGLTESNKEYGLIVAAKLLNQKILNEYDHQHCEILEQLSKINNPIVQSLL